MKQPDLLTKNNSYKSAAFKSVLYIFIILKKIYNVIYHIKCYLKDIIAQKSEPKHFKLEGLCRNCADFCHYLTLVLSLVKHCVCNTWLAAERVRHKSNPASTASDFRFCVNPTRLHSKLLLISVDLSKQSPRTHRQGKMRDILLFRPRAPVVFFPRRWFSFAFFVWL